MAITCSSPIVVNDVSYDKYAINMALSTVVTAGKSTVCISVRLTPYRDTEDGMDLLPDQARAIVFGNAMQEAQADAHLAAFMQAIEAAGQAFIDAKGV